MGKNFLKKIKKISKKLLTNYPECDIIDTERGENKPPRKREKKYEKNRLQSIQP